MTVTLSEDVEAIAKICSMQNYMHILTSKPLCLACVTRATRARLLAASKQKVPSMTRTLYIRHVPDDVAERLERLASRAGMPLSSFALQELSETARRADNVELLQALPSADLEAGEILEALRQSRAEH